MARKPLTSPVTARDSRMFKAGHDAAFELLVTIFEERGDAAFVMDAIEDNTTGDVRARFLAVYEARKSVRGY